MWLQAVLMLQAVELEVTVATEDEAPTEAAAPADEAPTEQAAVTEEQEPAPLTEDETPQD